MRILPLLTLAALLTSCAVGCAVSTANDDVATTDSALETYDDADDFYVIAHMTNTPSAARWAIEAGANAIEIDLRFDDGTPTSFVHGGICDCICAIGSAHVCSVLEDACEATSSVPEMFASLRSMPKLAMVMIDSKIDGDASADMQRSAGLRVIDAISEGLFAGGYAGKVVVAAPKTDARVYIETAAAAAARSPFAKRISFSFDQMGKSATNAACTLSTLAELSPNRVFGTGISACAIGDYTPAIGAAAESERGGVSGLTYVWTLDRAQSMRHYIDAGARGIITNKPALLVDVARSMGKTLARPSTTLRAATSAPAPTPCGD